MRFFMVLSVGVGFILCLSSNGCVFVTPYHEVIPIAPGLNRVDSGVIVTAPFSKEHNQFHSDIVDKTSRTVYSVQDGAVTGSGIAETNLTGVAQAGAYVANHDAFTTRVNTRIDTGHNSTAGGNSMGANATSSGATSTSGGGSSTSTGGSSSSDTKIDD